MCVRPEIVLFSLGIMDTGTKLRLQILHEKCIGGHIAVMKSSFIQIEIFPTNAVYNASSKNQIFSQRPDAECERTHVFCIIVSSVFCLSVSLPTRTVTRIDVVLDFLHIRFCSGPMPSADGRICFVFVHYVPFMKSSQNTGKAQHSVKIAGGPMGNHTPRYSPYAPHQYT